MSPDPADTLFLISTCCRSIFGTSSRRGRRPPGPGVRPSGPPPPRPDEDSMSMTPSMGRRGPPPRNRQEAESRADSECSSLIINDVFVSVLPQKNKNGVFCRGGGFFGGPSSRRSGRRPPPNRGRSAPSTPTDRYAPPPGGSSFEEPDRSFENQVWCYLNYRL